MAEEKVVVPTRDEIRVLGLDSEHTHDLIRQAQEADAADKQLTIKEAIKKYKKACFWAMILSTSLVMEGYDLVIVSVSQQPEEGQSNKQIVTNLPFNTSPSDHLLLRTDSVPEPFRYLRCSDGHKSHHGTMAISAF